MDNLNIKFRFLFLLGAIVLLLAFAGILTPSFIAYADGEYISEEVTVTADFLQGTNGITPVFSTFPYGDKADAYRKNVRAEFTVFSPYYRLTYTVGGEERAPSAVVPVPETGKVTFVAEETGLFVVTCEAFNEEFGEPVGQAECSFKNDMTAPFLESEAAEEMTEWKRSGQEYVVTVDWRTFTDANSGLYAFCYFLRYDNGTTSETVKVDFGSADCSSVVVDKKATLWLVAIDTAGNAFEKSYRMDKFDDVKPATPEYTVTPTVEEGKYADKYEIQVIFTTDNSDGSGLADIQHYRINGTTKAFEAKIPVPETIVLDKAADYRIVLYAMDNAGNVSDTREILIPFSVFDVTPPNIVDVTYYFDLTNPKGICTMIADVTDSGESGVESVYLSGKNVTLLPSALSGTSKYTASFDCFGFGPTITLETTDKLSHVASHTIAFPFFTDVEINEALKVVVGKFRAKGREEYTEAAWSNLVENSTKIGNLLRSESSSKEDIKRAIAALNALFDVKTETSYTIVSVPDFVSTQITFTVAESDSAAWKTGTNVSLALSKGEKQSKDYGDSAGFSDSFTDFFDLTVKLDGEEVKTPFTAGLTVYMDLPNGYYDRKVALFNAETGERVATETVNNRIVFNVKSSAKYALVIEGGKSPTGSSVEETRTITVFDRTMDLSTFLWIVCGCGGGALLLIAAVVVIGFFKG